MITELQSQLQKAQEEIAKLRSEVDALKAGAVEGRATPGTVAARVTEVTEPVAPVTDRPAGNVLGFTLALAKGFWYASRRRNGKNYTVYVGRDKGAAAAKIRAKFPAMVE